MNITDEIRHTLLSMADEGYRQFDLPLVPTVSPDAMLGVRFPALRKYAKELFARQDKDDFLIALPHRYYEENNLHAFLIEREKNYDRCIEKLDRFLPYVDNWATCDCMSPKVFKKHTQELYQKSLIWIKSGHTYTVRFGIKCLMSFFLDENFSNDVLEVVAKAVSEEYYINMMRAWFFATALAKQYESTICWLEEKRLDKWTHNKAIRKAIESYRVSDEHKSYLRTLVIR